MILSIHTYDLLIFQGPRLDPRHQGRQLNLGRRISAVFVQLLGLLQGMKVKQSRATKSEKKPTSVFVGKRYLRTRHLL